MTFILSFLWAAVVYFFEVIWVSCVTVFIFLPFVMIAAILQKMTPLLSRLWAEILGWRSWLYISSPGVAFHELAHAAFCLIFRHKINEIKLFTIRDDCLGYVSHSWNPDSKYQRSGNFFIGVAPILCGVTAVVLLTNMLMDVDVVVDLPSGNKSLWELGKLSVKSFWQIISSLCSFATLLRWQTLVWLVCLLLIGSHITLSRADMKGADKGFEGLMELIVLYHFFTVKFLPLPLIILIYLSDFLILGFCYMLLTLTLLTIILAAVYFLCCFVRYLKCRGDSDMRLQTIFFGNDGESECP